MRFVAAGLGFLFAALGLGIVMGVGYSSPGLASWMGVFSDGLKPHLLAGLVGCSTLMAIGVSYKLVSMFALAPEERGALGNAVLVLSASGVAATGSSGSRRRLARRWRTPPSRPPRR